MEKYHKQYKTNGGAWRSFSQSVVKVQNSELNAYQLMLAFGGALRDIQKAAARETKETSEFINIQEVFDPLKISPLQLGATWPIYAKIMGFNLKNANSWKTIVCFLGGFELFSVRFFNCIIFQLSLI